jgi:hypothetical protein
LLHPHLASSRRADVANGTSRQLLQRDIMAAIEGIADMPRSVLCEYTAQNQIAALPFTMNDGLPF